MIRSNIELTSRPKLEPYFSLMSNDLKCWRQPWFAPVRFANHGAVLLPLTHAFAELSDPEKGGVSEHPLPTTDRKISGLFVCGVLFSVLAEEAGVGAWGTKRKSQLMRSTGNELAVAVELQLSCVITSLFPTSQKVALLQSHRPSCCLPPPSVARHREPVR
jgi:hypothetical protein